MPPETKIAPPTEGMPHTDKGKLLRQKYDELLAHARELRTEALDLQKSLCRVGAGQASLKDLTNYITTTSEDMGKLVSQLETPIPHSEETDLIRHINNIWEQIRDVLVLIKTPKDSSNNSSASPEELTRHLNMLDELIKDMVFYIGWLTIPPRLSNWLKTARIGYYIPFHDVFEDEMPDRNDRIKLLNLLASSPVAIKHGLLDVENGLIYRCSSNRWIQLASFAGLILEIGIVVGVIFWLTALTIPDWKLGADTRGTLLIGWAAVLVGVVVHLAVDAAKKAQTQKSRPPFMSVWDLPLLVNAKLGSYLLKIFTAAIGLFGLAFGAGPDNVTPLNAFLVGYSLDSVIDLLSASIEQKSNQQISTLKQTLGVSS